MIFYTLVPSPVSFIRTHWEVWGCLRWIHPRSPHPTCILPYSAQLAPASPCGSTCVCGASSGGSSWERARQCTQCGDLPQRNTAEGMQVRLHSQKEITLILNAGNPHHHWKNKNKWRLVNLVWCSMNCLLNTRLLWRIIFFGSCLSRNCSVILVACCLFPNQEEIQNVLSQSNCKIK